MCDMKEMSPQELVSTIVGENAYKIAKLAVKNLYTMEETSQLYQYGLTEEEASKLLASITLAKRMFCDSVSDQLNHINNSRDIALYFAPMLRYETHEEVWVMALNAHNELIAVKKIFQGTLCGTDMSPREIFEFACLNHAACIVVVHNHPSGNPSPSELDDKATKNLLKAGKIMGIPLADHVIIGDGTYYSYFDDDKL